MKTKIFAAVLLLAISNLCLSMESLRVLVPAAIAPGTGIKEQFKEECDLQAMLGKQVLEHVSMKIASTHEVIPVSVIPTEKTLKTTITTAYGKGGGAWSGAKFMYIRAELLQEGKVIQSAELRRNSKGGLFGGISGTCQIMGRIAATIGGDVADWVGSQLSHR